MSASLFKSPMSTDQDTHVSEASPQTNRPPRLTCAERMRRRRERSPDESTSPTRSEGTQPNSSKTPTAEARRSRVALIARAAVTHHRRHGARLLGTAAPIFNPCGARPGNRGSEGAAQRREVSK
jgi:hypothetical protein